MKPITFEYKGALVAIELQEPGEKHNTLIAPKNLDERLQRELLPIIHYHIMQYNETGEVPPFEEARQYSAYACIGKEAFGGDLKQWSIADLAREARVTKEFAQYRLELEAQTDND